MKSAQCRSSGVPHRRNAPGCRAAPATGSSESDSATLVPVACAFSPPLTDSIETAVGLATTTARLPIAWRASLCLRMVRGRVRGVLFFSNRLVWLAPTFSPIVVPRSHRRLIGPTRWWANGHSHSVRRFVVVAVATLPCLIAGTGLSPSSPRLKSVGTEPVPHAGNKTFAQAWLTKLADAKKAPQRLPLHSLNAIHRHLSRTGAAQPLCCRSIRLDRGRTK